MDDMRLDARHTRTLRLARTGVILLLLLGACCWGAGRCACAPKTTSKPKQPVNPVAAAAQRSIKVATFLGNDQRRTYGSVPAPSALQRIWRFEIGAGWTRRKVDDKPVLWSGTGWTGQATVVEQGGKTWLVVGGYDHNLRKVDAATGKTEWEYAFDDVVKATNTVIVNPHPKGEADRLIVVAGSRRGSKYKVGDPRIAPLRAVSFATGKELWRYPFPKTANYSQDMDSSTLLIGDTLYAAIEPGYVVGLDPSKTKAWGKYRQPVVKYRSPRLFSTDDLRSHPDITGPNVAVEASPARIGNTLYVASGSGHVFGLRLPDLKVVWDLKTGSDIDGTPVVSKDNKILQAIERQYIPGHGGVMMIDPAKPAARSVVWYFPTINRGISEWKGGVIGSVGINDSAMMKSEVPGLAAFLSVDGFLYVVSQDQTATERVPGPDGKTLYPTPLEVFRDHVGGGTATPIIVGDKIIVGAFDKKVHLYRISYQPDAAESKGVRLKSRDGGSWRVSVREIATFSGGGPFESTAVVWGRRVFIGCRDGFFYCLGRNE
jgi:outer membrane protein assembly factor BamB